MASKNKPGVFDCYENAHPDEPMFVLLGRDLMAPALVRKWADMREATAEDPEKVAEARACANAMDEWATQLGKHDHGSGGSRERDLSVLEEAPVVPIESLEFGPMFRRLREERGYSLGDVSYCLTTRHATGADSNAWGVEYVSKVELGRLLPGSQVQTMMADAIGLVQGEVTTERLRREWEKKRGGY